METQTEVTTLASPWPRTKKLIHEDSKQVEPMQLQIESYCKQLQCVFNEGKRFGITLVAEGLSEMLRSPETTFKKELDATELKADKFLSLAKIAHHGLRNALPYLIVEDEVKVNQAALENYYDLNFRFYLTSEQDEQDLEKTIEFGKVLLSVHRFINKNKYSWRALEKSNPQIAKLLSNFIQKTT